MKKLYLILSTLLFSTYLYSQSTCPSLPTVTYGNQTYNTVLIGNQCWLKENLNIGTMVAGVQNQTNNSIIEKYCYNDSIANCTKYGGLYLWNEAMQYIVTAKAQGICPTGWHIPTNTDISNLSNSVAGNSNSLKAIGQGVDTSAGTNTSGFSALLTGYHNGAFSGLGIDGYYWTSTALDTSHSDIMDLSAFDKTIHQYSTNYLNGMSIRCLLNSQLLLQAPNGGENWQIGSTQKITWTSSYVSNIKIDFTTNNGTSWTTISASTPALAGSFNWAILNTPSTQCRVRLIDLSDTTNKSISANVFTISGRTIAITAPNGGENWRVGEVDTIRWTSSSLANIKIEITTNNDTTWNTIISSTPSQAHQYFWKIPNILSSNCKVRLSYTDVLIINSTSANVFTISNPPCPGLATVVYSGQTYNTVMIGNQCWLKENLNVGTRISGLQEQTNNGIIEKYCYNNDPTNCNTYGGLYRWAEAVQYQNGATNNSSPIPPYSGHIQGICPTGWHLPDSVEFSILSTTVGNNANSLKEIGQGSGIGIGTNLSGFSSLLSGTYYPDGTYSLLGIFNFFISSTESDPMDTYYLTLVGDSNNIFIGNKLKSYGRSVRCINDNITGINEKNIPELPKGYSLLQNYPNPFNPTTIISYQVPANSHITIKIFDAIGNEIATLVNEYKPAGSYEVKFNGSKLSSGVYFYQMKAGNFSATKKLIIMK